ncbi:Gfo/Idh/MocA family protein [Gorillibacterium timonense]|uniref:Gfo/Idh/MocA family protein n=1 Tax=Gorillibacterium timonense TaxID=1689269 RepID=UPI00071DC802|nr:Gfo/Idh/MocA family oxidoreductase [Gorillibacterium timonense]
MSLRIGFVGTGGISRAHQDQLSRMNDVEVTGFVSGNFDNAVQAAGRWPNAKAYAHVTDMLDAGPLDAVYICVPPDAHEGLEELLVDRRIPFLVEKPLAASWDLPARIAAKVEAAGLLTSVAYHWRYLDSVAAARSELANTAIGLVNGYWMGTMPRAEWWINYDRSGGQFVEQTTHIVDLLRDLCGEVTEVYAAYSQRVMHERVPRTTVYDVGSVTFKLASGAVATVSNTCLLPHYHKTGLDVYTDKGVIELRDSSMTVLEEGRKTELRYDGQAFRKENEAFIHALRTGDRSLIRSDYADALKTFELTLAANWSARTGKPVRLEEKGWREDAQEES